MLFTHWSPNVRQVFHRLLVYKMYRCRRAYLPVCNSCEWLAILFGVFKKHYSPNLRWREASHPELASVFGFPKRVDDSARDHLFRTDQESGGAARA